MATIPWSYVDLAQLGIKVAENWANLYPNYTANFTTAADLLVFHQDFLTSVTKSKEQDGIKQEDTTSLKTINETIDSSLAQLKISIKFAHRVTNSSFFSAYGIAKKNNAYIFPRDNDGRNQALTMLINKLREPNNIVAQQPEGLQFWADLAAAHAQAWRKTSTTPAVKSSFVGTNEEMFEQSSELLRKLRRQIQIDFPKKQVSSVIRSFGFLEESF